AAGAWAPGGAPLAGRERGRRDPPPRPAGDQRAGDQRDQPVVRTFARRARVALAARYRQPRVHQDPALIAAWRHRRERSTVGKPRSVADRRSPGRRSGGAFPPHPRPPDPRVRPEGPPRFPPLTQEPPPPSAPPAG